MKLKRRKQRRKDTDADRLADIRRRYDKAELHPWRAYKGKFGWDVVEPRAFYGCDTIIAWNLDGDTAALLADVPTDMRFLLRLAERLIGKKKES